MHSNKSDPFEIVREFERALCAYTGAKYAVTTTSCTSALMLALAWHKENMPGRTAPGGIEIPRHTYVGVPASILNAGFDVDFRDEWWDGEYQLKPLNVWDAARRFTSGMYWPGTMQCVSFHTSKILGLAAHGGAILHDYEVADEWLRRARFDGRGEGIDPRKDKIQYPSWHCYMTPATAAEGLMRLAILPENNPNLPCSEYPDCSKIKAFQ